MSMVDSVPAENRGPNDWWWVVPYSVAVLLALVLASVLGNFPIFRHTFLPATKLSAADLVGFIGYGGALLLFWIVGKRTALHLDKSPAAVAFLRPVVMPTVMLIVLSIGYYVVLLVAGPFLGKSGQALYDWIFIVGLIAASFWLTMSWLQYSAPLLESAAKPVTLIPQISCPRCNALLINAAKYCGECGARLPRAIA
jgi:hypothetical protein